MSHLRKLSRKVGDLYILHLYPRKGKVCANITKVASRPLRERKRQVVEEDSDAVESLGDEDTDEEEEEESEEEVKPKKKPKVKAKRKPRKQSGRNRTR